MHGPRSGLARMLLFVGGLAAALAWWGFAAQQTLLDPSATRDATVGLLSAKPVQDSAVGSLADQLVNLIPQRGQGAVVTPEQARALSRRAATTALQDPALRRAFGDALASLQQQLIDGGGKAHQLTIDSAAVTTAVRDAVQQVDPRVAARMPSAPLQLHFDTSRMPSLHGVDRHTGTVTWLAALIALAAWFGAVVVHPEPWTATRVIGRRVAEIGVLPLVFWVLIPAALRALHVSAAEVLSPLASAYGGRLAPAASSVVAVGVLLWFVGRFGALAVRPNAGGGRMGSAPAVPIGAAPRRRRSARDVAVPLDRVDVRA